MCLDVVDKEPTVKEGIGWKVFIKRDNKLRNCYQWIKEGHKGVFVFPINRWIVDKGDELISTEKGDSSYKKGFHIFENENSTIEFATSHVDIIKKKIKFRKVVATGKELTGNRVIVAREILILPDKV